MKDAPKSKGKKIKVAPKLGSLNDTRWYPKLAKRKKKNVHFIKFAVGSYTQMVRDEK